MKKQEIFVRDISDGLILKKPVYNEGIELLSEGVILKERYIEMLEKNNIQTVMVEESKEQVKNKIKKAQESSNALDPYGNEDVLDKKINKENFNKVLTVEIDSIINANIINGVDIESKADNLRNKIKSISKEMFNREKNLDLILDVNEDSKEIFKHNVRTSLLAVLIGSEMGLNKFKLYEVFFAGIFVDVGKKFIDDSILYKNGTLSTKEYHEVKKHSILGANYIKEKTKVSPNIVNTIKYHHENYNGSGYPEGLSGKNIPLYARILKIADSYIAMTSLRSYRNSLSPTQAIKLIEAQEGIIYDSDLIQVLKKSIYPYKVGKKVLLSNGFVVTVVKNNKGYPLSPIVKFANNEVLDLMSNKSLEIKSYT